MGFRDPYFLYIILCNQKEVKHMTQAEKVFKELDDLFWTLFQRKTSYGNLNKKEK